MNALQYSTVLEEHKLQCVVTGNRRFDKGLEVPCKYTFTGKRVDQQTEVLTPSGSSNTLLHIFFVHIMNHFYLHLPIMHMYSFLMITITYFISSLPLIYLRVFSDGLSQGSTEQLNYYYYNLKNESKNKRTLLIIGQQKQRTIKQNYSAASPLSSLKGSFDGSVLIPIH